MLPKHVELRAEAMELVPEVLSSRAALRPEQESALPFFVHITTGYTSICVYPFIIYLGRFFLLLLLSFSFPSISFWLWFWLVVVFFFFYFYLLQQAMSLCLPWVRLYCNHGLVPRRPGNDL